MSKLLLFVIACLLPFVLPSDWSYSDQDAWSGSCNSNDNIQQSPINIKTRSLQQCDTSTPDLDWNVSHIEQFHVNNVRSHLKLDLMSDEHPDKHGLLRNNFVTSSNEHTTYILQSAHIHWKSEHTINGRRGGLEVDFLHYSSDYDNITHALYASSIDEYRLAVVAVIFDKGKSNDFFSSFIANDDFDKLQNGNSIHIDNLDIHKLLPFAQGESANDIAYYHYKGSLTMPPCSTIVHWFVLKDKLSISKWQLQQLRSLKDADGNQIKDNFRNLQPIVNHVHLCNYYDTKRSYSASSSDSRDSSSSGGRRSAEISDRKSHNDGMRSSKSTINTFLADFGTILLIAGLLFMVALAFGVWLYFHCAKKIERRKRGHVKIKNVEEEDEEEYNDDVELDIDGLEEGRDKKESETQLFTL